jgi:hypothetical protein
VGNIDAGTYDRDVFTRVGEWKRFISGSLLHLHVQIRGYCIHCIQSSAWFMFSLSPVLLGVLATGSVFSGLTTRRLGSARLDHSVTLTRSSQVFAAILLLDSRSRGSGPFRRCSSVDTRPKLDANTGGSWNHSL